MMEVVLPEIQAPLIPEDPTITAPAEDAPTGGYPSVDWPDKRRTPAPSQCSTPRLSRERTAGNLSNTESETNNNENPQTAPVEASRVYITEFSDDDDQSVLDRDTCRSINVLDDDDVEDGSGSCDSSSLPPPSGGVDIFNADSYDTDLDVDDEFDPIVRKPADYDQTGIKDYIQECNSLGVIPVSYFQKHVQDNRFVMKHHGLGPMGAKAISKPLEGNTWIETLDLEGNFIGGLGTVHLCKALKDNIFITTLVLAENCLNSMGVKAVCNMLEENSTIVELDLSGNNLKDRDGEPLFKMLEKNRSVRSLNLRHNCFEVDAARWLRDGFISNVHVRQLDLSWNNFRLKGAQYLAELIQENYGLKYINLSMNGLGTEGAGVIGRALVYNQCLEELNLTSNRVGDEGAMLLARGLEINEWLSTFRVGQNPITPEGCLPFMTAMYKNDNTGLLLLDLTNVVVTDQFETVLNEKIVHEKERDLSVIHGGVLFQKKQLFTIEETDLALAFARDPMTKLREFADRNKLRLIDVFRQFDRDQSMSLSYDEFKLAIEKLRSQGFEMSDEDADKLIKKLDKDGDGEIDYGEFVEGDKENRANKRRVQQWQTTRMKMTEEQGVQTETTIELNI